MIYRAQSLNIVSALEVTRTLRKARLDLFAAESPLLQGEFKRKHLLYDNVEDFDQKHLET